MEEKDFVLDEYPVILIDKLKGASARIVLNSDYLEYQVVEPKLEQEELDVYYKLYSLAKQNITKNKLKKLTNDLSSSEALKIYYHLYKNLIGLNSIEPLVKDKQVKFIFIKFGKPIKILHSNPRFGYIKTNLTIKSLNEFNEISKKIKNKSKSLRNGADYLGVFGDFIVNVKDVEKEILFFKKKPAVKIRDKKLVDNLSQMVKNGASILIAGSSKYNRALFASYLLSCINKKVGSLEKVPYFVMENKHWYPNTYKCDVLFCDLDENMFFEILNKTSCNQLIYSTDTLNLSKELIAHFHTIVILKDTDDGTFEVSDVYSVKEYLFGKNELQVSKLL
ncbi:MAG: hypothetical protein J7K22_02505 [Nanoarchaeota archaeon]|nr:hypothetical protein [Nanoarchaeota archaeon]